MNDIWTIDLETHAIDFTSNRMPTPVGLAVRPPTGGSYYLAWGHPTGNNATLEQAVAFVATLAGKVLLGHNLAKFDVPVMQEHLGLGAVDPRLVHDTMLQAYLIDPNVPQIGLKWLAENWLGMPADDQEAMQDWILANVPECRTRKQCGAHISKAPGDMVGPYAISDVEMTWALHEHCYPKLTQMLEPYDRELALAPILVDIHRKGIRIDVKRLDLDYRVAMGKLHELDDLVRSTLHSPNLNPGSDRELVSALQGAGFSGFLTTPTGKLSANKESLHAVLAQAPELQSTLRSRAALSTLTGTFMLPWLEIARANGGTINPEYSSTRNENGYGTRTGRLSSSNPNGQNVPTNLGKDYYGDPFPEMRSYCLPDEGCVWYSVDFKAQEPRLAAHFEDGLLLRAFQEEPDLDPYQLVMQLVGGDVTRKDAKVVFLGLLYSMGAQALADKLGCDASRATSLRNAIRAAIPDINNLDRDCKRRFELGLPIKTLGGRYVNCEPPSHGRVWAYKALNLLIQGSAADQTKEAMVWSHSELAVQPFYSRILGTVHDEINLCAPEKGADTVKMIMLEAANALPCDVPMRISFGVGSTWAEASK